MEHKQTREAGVSDKLFIEHELKRWAVMTRKERMYVMAAIASVYCWHCLEKHPTSNCNNQTRETA